MRRFVFLVDFVALGLGVWAGLLATFITTPIMLLTAPALIPAAVGVATPQWVSRKRVLSIYVHASAVLAFASALFVVIYMNRP